MIKICALAALWLIGAVAALLFLWPSLPQSAIQWALLLALGPPLYLVGEIIFSCLLTDERGRRVSEARFSFLRIGLVLAVLAACLGLSVALVYWLWHP